MEAMISARNISKVYGNLMAVKDLSLDIGTGFHVIMGRSGSGKTTLLNMLGLLDDASSGEIYIREKLVSDMKARDKAFHRMKDFGFVFQAFHLHPKLKAFENVMIPMYINPELKTANIRERALELLVLMELGDRSHHFPDQLSGGQQQRVAIARALANNPTCIFADEPTGNLDAESEKIVLSHLKNISEKGRSVVVVTHNEAVMEYADRIFHMTDGVLEEKQ